jgi:hypothetical protein
MSQGNKQKPEPSLFILTGEVYDHIPKEHFYEELDRMLDLSFVYELTRPLYARKMGRPSLDPVSFQEHAGRVLREHNLRYGA